jgi:hypothetical protein
MSVWRYLNRPTNLAFHDLTTKKKPPANLRSLLGLSLKFIPNPSTNVPWSNYAAETLPRFHRDFQVKAFMAKPPVNANDDPPEDSQYNPRLYVRTNWTPPSIFPFPKEATRRINYFNANLRRIVRRRKCRSNLLPHQRQALRYLRNQNEFLVIQCDKNLGPAIIETDEYIKMALRDHLSDATTYQRLSQAEAKVHELRIRNFLGIWLKKWAKVLTKNEKRFIKHHIAENKFPFAAFYLTAKVHKTPLASRPIVSCSGSLLAALGTWVDDKLQHAVKIQPSYFKSSFDLRKEIDTLELPPNATLFTADAVSMYTNIPTDRALLFIGKYLRSKVFPGIPTEALMEALRCVMKNNIFTFGDTIWKQKTGTAMGTPPAPPWATLYYALCENKFLKDFALSLLLYRRFIDDIFGIWIPSANADDDTVAWTEFQAAVNDPLFGLEWIVQPRSQSVDFMDLTISIRGNRLHTTLYEKPSNLHLYIPPHSCHPPGLLPGMVHGMVHRFFSLCTDDSDICQRIKDLYRALLRRGYQPAVLKPLLQKAISHTKETLNRLGPATTSSSKDLRYAMLLHLRYHPLNPSSKELQHLWRTHISEPLYGRPLAELRNYNRIPLGINRLIIAYSRPPNLGNLLSYRKLKNHGPPVSSYVD